MVVEIRKNTQRFTFYGDEFSLTATFEKRTEVQKMLGPSQFEKTVSVCANTATLCPVWLSRVTVDLAITEGVRCPVAPFDDVL